MAAAQSVQLVIDEIHRTVAVASWRRSLLNVEAEAKRLARKHHTVLVPLHEFRELFIRIAAERQVLVETRPEGGTLSEMLAQPISWA
jgi:hypothetical protein